MRAQPVLVSETRNVGVIEICVHSNRLYRRLYISESEIKFMSTTLNPKLACCLKHQLTWVLLAIFYNLVSLWSISNHGKSLSPTDPFIGILVFLLFLPVLVLGLKGNVKAYLVLSLLFWVMIAFGGVLQHVVNVFSPQGLNGYLSVSALVVGVVINTYGVGVSIISNVISFRLLYPVWE